MISKECSYPPFVPIGALDSVGELEPVRKLGINTIGVLTGFSSKDDMERASMSTIQDITQLVKILE